MRTPKRYSPQSLSQSSPWHTLGFLSSCLISGLRHLCLVSQALAKPVILLVLYISNFHKGPQPLVAESRSLGLWWVSGGTCYLQSSAHIAPGRQHPRQHSFAVVLFSFSTRAWQSLCSWMILTAESILLCLLEKQRGKREGERTLRAGEGQKASNSPRSGTKAVHKTQPMSLWC